MIQQISEEQYRLLINNRTLFKNIKHIKKEKNKIYISFEKDTSDKQKYQILKNNNYYLPIQYRWVDMSYENHNIIINPTNPNIIGYSYSDGTFNSKNKAIYEYFERLCCFTPPTLIYDKPKGYQIDYDQLGIDWSNSETVKSFV